MGEHVIVQQFDDLTEEVGDDIETVAFSHAGTDYEIDLNEENRGELAAALADFVAVARVVGGKGAPKSRGRKTSTSPRGGGHSRETSKHIREWAAKQGWQISERGRIPAEVNEAWERAHAGGNGAVVEPVVTEDEVVEETKQFSHA